MSREQSASRTGSTGAAVLAAGAGLLLAAAALGACASGAPEHPAQLLDSRVRDASIDVDGFRRDWEGNLTRVGDRNVFAGFYRRGDVLYMAIVSQDAGFDARVFRSGLTVWFDTTATRRRVRGIRFPVFGPEARKRLRADSASGSPDRERLLRAAGSDFVLVTGGTHETELTPAEADGLELAAAVDRGLFTWELRVPLGGAGGPSWALPVTAGDTISVGLQAGGDQGGLSAPPPSDSAAADSARAEEPPPEPAEPGEPGEPGEEPGKAPREPPARRGRLPGPGAREVPELEIWFRVNLAGQATVEPAAEGAGPGSR